MQAIVGFCGAAALSAAGEIRSIETALCNTIASGGLSGNLCCDAVNLVGDYSLVLVSFFECMRQTIFLKV